MNIIRYVSASTFHLHMSGMYYIWYGIYRSVEWSTEDCLRAEGRTNERSRHRARESCHPY